MLDVDKSRKGKSHIDITEATSWRKDEKERKKDYVSPFGLHQVTDRLEKIKEQTKYKQYKVEKLRRRKLAGR